MKSRSNCAAENREGSGASAGSSWHRKALAMGTAVIFAFSPMAPAWAAPKGAAALSATGAAAKLAVATPALTAAGGCQLNSPRGKVTHVVTIIFDNTHFMRDPARDGSTLVPSDLEQMPHLLNFIKENGALLSNHHTRLSCAARCGECGQQLPGIHSNWGQIAVRLHLLD